MAELKLGIAGLGTAANLVLPYVGQVQNVRLTAGADIRPKARAGFTAAYSLPAFDSVAELSRSDMVDAVWIETPNHLHCEHAVTAAEGGKHVIVAKPMAASVAECDRMMEAARANGVRILIGHSKIFDPPIRAMGEIARSGRLGKVIQIDSWLYNDWLRRPRLPEELDKKKGAGFVLRQAPHLIDIAHYIVNAAPVALSAVTGRWDPHVSSEGNAHVQIRYASGAFASLSLNGYGYFDTSELTWDIGTFGATKPGAGSARPRPRSNVALTDGQKFSGLATPAQAATPTSTDAMPFFGLHIVSFERGVVRQSPQGLFIYTEEGREEVTLPLYLGRAAELIELRDAIAEDRDVFPNGEWGRENLKTCLAILTSASEAREIAL